MHNHNQEFTYGYTRDQSRGRAWDAFLSFIGYYPDREVFHAFRLNEVAMKQAKNYIFGTNPVQQPPKLDAQKARNGAYKVLEYHLKNERGVDFFTMCTQWTDDMIDLSFAMRMSLAVDTNDREWFEQLCQDKEAVRRVQQHMRAEPVRAVDASAYAAAICAEDNEDEYEDNEYEDNEYEDNEYED